MRPITVTTANIDKIISDIKADIQNDQVDKATGYPLILPIGYRDGINRKKYKGRGRPRDTDYIIKEYDWDKILSTLPK